MERKYIEEIFKQSGALITNDHFVVAMKDDGWYHSADYFNKDALGAVPYAESECAKALAELFWHKKVEVVVGAACGGIGLAKWTAYWCNYFLRRFTLQQATDVLAVYADEEDILETGEEIIAPKWQGMKRDYIHFIASGRVDIEIVPVWWRVTKIAYQKKIGTRRVFRRGYDKIINGKRCLIVEDVINSGTTVKKMREAVEHAGGKVVGVVAECNRSGGKVGAEILGVPECISLVELDLSMYREDECPICKEKGRLSVRTDIGHGKEFVQRISTV